MADNVQSMMLDILKRIQADVAGVKTDVAGLKTDMADVKGRLERLEARFERLETSSQKQSRDSAAMLVMMRATVGVFDDRVSSLENDVRMLLEREP